MEKNVDFSGSAASILTFFVLTSPSCYLLFFICSSSCVYSRQELEGVDRGFEWRPGTTMEFWLLAEPVVKEAMDRKRINNAAH